MLLIQHLDSNTKCNTTDRRTYPKVSNTVMFNPNAQASATCLTRVLNADANMGHGFAIVMAHVGTLRPFGAPAPVN